MSRKQIGFMLHPTAFFASQSALEATFQQTNQSIILLH